MPDVEVRALRIRVEVDEGSLNRSRELIENMVNNLQSKCKLALSIDTKALASSTAGVMSTVTKAATESAAAVEKTTGAAFSEKKLKPFYLAQQKMQLQLNRMGSGASTKEFEHFTELLNNVSANGGKGFDELAGAAMRARDSIGALNREMNDAADIEGLRTRLANKLSGGEWLSGQAARLQSSFVDADPALVQAATSKLNEIRELGDVAQMSESELNALNNALNQYNALMNAVGASNAANRSLREQATALANLKSQYQSYMAAYGKNLSKNIPLMNRFLEFGRNLNSGAMTSGDAARQFAELRAQAQAAGVEVETTGQRMHNLFSTHFNTAIIMYALYGLRTMIRQLWRDIKDLNDALVQVQIVTGRTGASLRNYVEDAYSAAERSKDKVTNILEESTAYGRLGYDSDLSMQLAELTSMYGKIGNVETQEATDAITALMKAFNLENADQIEDALDKMIYVGNNFPISAAGLGESLNNAASALASSGNTLEQSLAMLMVANETVQNPSKSSTAMRTMTARIRNSKAELEELGEEMEEKWNTVSKYREQLLGVSGVDILDATGKEFKSTADILGELASVWQNLSSVERATVTTMVAGTRNQDIFASLMANWGDYEKAMAGMGDAGGLMQEKFSAVEQSLSGSLSGLSNAFSKFSNTLINSGDISVLVKGLTGLLNVLSSLVKTMGGGAFMAGTLAMVSFFSKLRTFSATWPSMQAAMSSLRGIYAGTGSILNPTQLQAATTALAGFSNAQQRAIMSGAGFTTAAQEQVLTMQGMSTAGLGASGAMSTLGASVDGLKAKMTAFVQSGNIWITLIMLLAQVVMSVINLIQQNNQAAEQAAEEAKRKAEEAQQAEREAMRATNASVMELNSGDKSASSYRDRLIELADKLENATIGSQEYKNAQLELYGVQSDIIEQFGAESGAVRGVSEDLRDYANRLDDVAKRKQYLALLEGENYTGTAAALKLFGIDPSSGKMSNATNSVTISLNGITLNPRGVSGTYSQLTDVFYYHDSEYFDAVRDAVSDFLGGQFNGQFTYNRTGYTIDHWRESPNNYGDGYIDYEVLEHLWDDATEYATIELTSLTLEGNAREVLDGLNNLLKKYIAEGDTQSATYISQIIKEYKDQTNYDEALEIFNRYAEGQMLYGDASTALKQPYQTFSIARDAFQQALASGNTVDAMLYLDQMLTASDEIKRIAHEQGYTWAEQYVDGVIDGFGDSELLRDIKNGFLKTNTPGPVEGSYLSYDIRNIDQLYAENIKLAGSFKSLDEARDAGFASEYLAYQGLIGAAQRYGMTLEDLINLLIQLKGLQTQTGEANGSQYSTFHNNAGSGLDVQDPFSNESVLKATGSVASVKDASDKLFDAEATRDRIKEAFDSGEEIAQEDIDAIKEYVGDTFDEIDEDVLASIDETLDESRDEVSTSIEGLANSAIKWMEDNVEGFNLADYIDTDGNIDFSGIIAAFQNSGVEEAAGAAGANASMSYLSQLQTVGGATIRAKLDADGLGYTTEFSGGSAGGGGGKRGGGGGGGKKSKISDDIENVERMIDLFKKLLNYYEEGSDQWIARQTQLIDKYKAGVEIAMNEYRRLKAKGLKETDDDVKKLVDTILEYQDSIYEESEKLWEAVRQNQIDSLKHLKDQNDAAIDLEETHHDLLIAIRDERRELEDELKAARDAYSEVMTPEELDAMFSVEDYAELMDKLATIEGDAMSMYRDYKEQIAAVSEDETYMIEHITDEFKRQYELKMKEYEITKAELGVKRAQQELENVKNEQTVMMLIGGKWQWVADPEKVLEAEQNLADAEQELADAQDEFDFQSLINEMEAQSSGIQQQIDALEALTFSMDDLAEQIHLFSDSVYKELLTYLSQIAQGIFDKYEGDTAVPAFAEGGVIKRGGLAMVHSGEPIFSTADAEKLWRFVHDLGDTPVNTLGVYSGIANKLLDSGVDTLGGVSTVAIDNSINIPGGIHVHGEMAQQLITLLKEVVAPYQPNV
jgi:TP901 family phage tail tape measure protein